MELELSEFDAPAALADAMTLIRERAMKHGIALGLDVAPGIAAVTADERKFKQILLNCCRTPSSTRRTAAAST